MVQSLPTFLGFPKSLQFFFPDVKMGIKTQSVSLLHKQIFHWDMRYPSTLIQLAPSISVYGFVLEFCRWMTRWRRTPVFVQIWRSRCQDGVRCSRALWREMSIRQKGWELEKAARATRLSCWSDLCGGDRAERKKVLNFSAVLRKFRQGCQEWVCLSFPDAAQSLAREQPVESLILAQCDGYAPFFRKIEWCIFMSSATAS